MFEFFFRGGRGVSADLEPFSIFLEYFYKWELPDRPAPAPVAGYVPRNDIVKQSMLNSRRGHFYTMTNCTTSLYGSRNGFKRLSESSKQTVVNCLTNLRKRIVFAEFCVSIGIISPKLAHVLIDTYDRKLQTCM